MKKMKKIIPYIVDVLLMGVLIWFDQFTKSLAVEKLMNQEPYQIIPDVLQLNYLENRGAAFGILQNQKWFFLIIGIVFMIVILIALVYIPAVKKYTALRICLLLIGAGAIGNMIDRFSHIYVIDFIYVVYINFPIFNVADCYLSCATFFLIILILFFYKEDDLNFKKARTPKVHSSMRDPSEHQS
jgi:signal peptidase II